MFLEYFNQFVIFVESLDKFTAFWVLILSKIIAGTLLIPGTPLTLLSGAVLGKFWGTLAAVIGNTIGACISFFVGQIFVKAFCAGKNIG